MADKTFIPTTGAQTWINTANWNGGTLPVDADNVYIKAGDASLVITAGTTQAGIQLARCQLWDTFKGSFDVDVQSVIWDIGLPSGSDNGNSGSGDVTITNGTQVTTVNVYKTAASTNATSGEQALKFTGTGATNIINILSGSPTVDIGADLSATVVDDLNIIASGAKVVIGANATVRDVVVTGGTLLSHGLFHASSTLIQNGGTVWTYGATYLNVATINGGTSYLNHRTSGNDAGTVTINSGGTVNLVSNPTAFTTASAIVVNPGGKLVLFNFAQAATGITFASPATLSVAGAT